MPVNTPQLDDGRYVVTSSISVAASRSSLAAQDVTATSVLSGNVTTITGAATLRSTLSVSGAVTMQGAAQVRSALTGLGWVYGGVFISSATTAQSGATSRLSQQGQLYFSVLSLTTNGAEFGFRSGNTVYIFQSTAVG